MKIGYARVSTEDQDCSLQVMALEGAGVERIYTEQASGGRWDRPELHKMMDALRKGDELFVWKMDRLSRSLADFSRLLCTLDQKGVSFRSCTEPVETASPAGRMLANILCVFAEFEREILKQRTTAGLHAAMKRGARPGRPQSLTDGQKTEARKLIKEGRSKADVARLFQVHPSIISRLQ